MSEFTVPVSSSRPVKWHLVREQNKALTFTVCGQVMSTFMKPADVERAELPMCKNCERQAGQVSADTHKR